MSVCYDRLADLALAAGRSVEAEQLFRQSLTVAEELAASEPGNTTYRRDVSICYERLAVIATGTDSRAALVWANTAVNLRHELHTAEPTRLDLAVELAYARYLRATIGGDDRTERASIAAILTPFAETHHRLDQRGAALLTWANTTDTGEPPEAPLTAQP